MDSKSPSQLNPYEKLYGRKLTEKETKEARSNIVGFFELLAQMDKQRKEAINEKQNIRSSNNSH
jgi:hypothetical protein